MISSPLPLPASSLPVPTPIAPANPAPPATGASSEAKPGGFARLLDQAREDPADAAATPPPAEAATERTAARARALRAGAPRPADLKAGTRADVKTDLDADATAEKPSVDNDRGDSAEQRAIHADEKPAEAAAAPGPSADTAALLASLAAFNRPQPAPDAPAGKAARKGADETAPSSRAQGPALARPQADDSRTGAEVRMPAPGPDAGSGDHPASTSALANDPRTAADAAVPSGGRSFASELQATLNGATLAQAPAPMVATTATPAAAPSAASQLAASPGSPAFAPELGATLATFVRDGVQHARLELNPAEMGPLTVQIQLDGQTAQVHLAAQNADTRQALEQAMPTLAGSLREAGLTLSGGGVFEQPRQAQQENARGDSRSGAAGGESDDPLAQAQPAAPTRRRGVVDLVA